MIDKSREPDGLDHDSQLGLFIYSVQQLDPLHLFLTNSQESVSAEAKQLEASAGSSTSSASSRLVVRQTKLADVFAELDQLKHLRNQEVVASSAGTHLSAAPVAGGTGIQ